MLNEGTHIDLVTRWRTISRVLDILVPEPTSPALEDADQAALDAAGRRELTEAIMQLEEGVQANPFRLRGYLFLATIYEYAQNAESAIATIEQGLAICASGLRLLSAQRWAETLERINGPVAYRRISNHVERLRQYERMFRHRLVMLRSTAAGLMKRLNNGPPSKRCIAPKEG